MNADPVSGDLEKMQPDPSRVQRYYSDLLQVDSGADLAETKREGKFFLYWLTTTSTSTTSSFSLTVTITAICTPSTWIGYTISACG